MVVTLQTFPQIALSLDVLVMNCLASDSPSLIQVDKVNLNQVFILISLWFDFLPGHLQGLLYTARLLLDK